MHYKFLNCLKFFFYSGGIGLPTARQVCQLSYVALVRTSSCNKNIIPNLLFLICFRIREFINVVLLAVVVHISLTIKIVGFSK